jgi:hypothetical protein
LLVADLLLLLYLHDCFLDWLNSSLIALLESGGTCFYSDSGGIYICFKNTSIEFPI